MGNRNKMGMLKRTSLKKDSKKTDLDKSVGKRTEILDEAKRVIRGKR